MPLPPQDELRRRLKAARLLTDLTVKQLAERVDPEAGMQERVLRRLETGESVLKAPQLREIANALGFPYAWFTVPSIPAAVDPDARLSRSEAAHLRDRLDRLEALLEAEPRGSGPAEEGSNGDENGSPATAPRSSSRRGPRVSRQAREQ